MTTIRKGTLADVPEIVRMSAAFYPTTHYAQWCDMDEETVADLASSLIENHIFFVAEDGDRLVGMVGLFIIPFMFNRHATSAGEVVWWVDPEARGSRVAASLLQAVECACRDAGADRIQMVHMPNSPPQAAALYERLGYSRSEISYTKDI
jgi:GNAT superfamily N-acetyltransferase